MTMPMSTTTNDRGYLRGHDHHPHHDHDHDHDRDHHHADPPAQAAARGRPAAVPEHHHDGALAARHHHQPLPDHERGRDDHAEVQHLVVELVGGEREGEGNKGRRGQPGPCRRPPPGPAAPRTCRRFMRRTSSRKSSDSIAAPRRAPRLFRFPPLPPAASDPAPPRGGDRGGPGAPPEEAGTGQEAAAARPSAPFVSPGAPPPPPSKHGARAGTVGCFYLKYFEVNIVARHKRRCGLNRLCDGLGVPPAIVTLRRLPRKTFPRLMYTVSKNTKSPNCLYQNTLRQESEQFECNKINSS